MARSSDGIHALQAQRFAALSAEALAYDPERSLLLGMQALDATLRHGEPTEFAADEALREAMWRSRLYRALRYGATDGSPTCAAWNRDGTRLVTGSSLGPIVLWDIASGERLWNSGESLLSYCIAWSPDGTRIAAGGLGKNVLVLNAADGTPVNTIATRGGTGLAFSPDGRRLAIQAADGSGVWDIETGARLFALGGGSLANIAWSPDGKRIATCANDIRLWDADTGAALQTLGPERILRAVDWSPDGTQLAAGLDARCEVWDIASGTQRMIASEFASSGGIVAWSPDGTRLAKRGYGDTATIHDADEGRVLLTLKGQFAGDYAAPPSGIALAWHPNGTRLAIAPGTNGPPPGAADSSSDARAQRAAYQSVKLWDVRPDDLFDGDLCLASTQPQTVLDAAWSPDGERIAISTEDAVVVLDGDNGLPSQRFPSQTPDATHLLHWSPDGVWLATSDLESATDPRRITRLWRVADGEALTTLPAAAPIAVGALRLPSWSADGRRLAALADDGRTHVWDMRTLQHLSSFEDASSVARLALSPDGTRLAASTRHDAAIRIRDVESGRLSIVLGSTAPLTDSASDHRFAVDGLVWCPDGQRIVAITADNVTTWDIATGEPSSTFANLKGYPGFDAFDAGFVDDRYFQFDQDRTRVALLSILNFETTHGKVGIPQGTTGVAFRDMGSGQPLPEPDFMRFENFPLPLDNRPYLIRWRPDGRQSASAMQMSRRLYDGPNRSAWGDIDRSVRVTDAASGREAFAVGRAEIDGMAWRPDGKRLACWRGNRLEIHPTDPHELMALARTKVTRNFTFDECVRYFHGEDPPPIP